MDCSIDAPDDLKWIRRIHLADRSGHIFLTELFLKPKMDPDFVSKSLTQNHSD